MLFYWRIVEKLPIPDGGANDVTIRAVFFDAVGTLIHPVPAAATVYAEVGKRFGGHFDERTLAQAMREAFLRQEDVDRRQGWRTSETREIERWRTIVGEVLPGATNPEACFATLYDHFSLAANWRIEPGTTYVVAALRQRGLAVGLASNYDRRLYSVVQGMPALAGLAAIVISSEVGWRKPGAAFFATMCDTVQIARQETVYVGDDLINDYEGARAARCQAVLYDPAGQSAADISSIGNLEGILGWLDRECGQGAQPAPGQH